MSIWLTRFSITTLLVMLSFVSAASAFPAPISTPATATGQIPSQSDWTDRGPVLSPGPAGSWDARLTGSITPTTVVEMDGVFYLYYIGADGNRSTDGGPRHRALGVATSIDGVNFTKYSGNPVITHLPNDNEEEGVFSAGAIVADGQVLLYYGAMDGGNATSGSVDGDVRLAVSSDGLNFTDMGDVVSHADDSVWGGGDELFPVGVHQDKGTTYVYYIAKSGGTAWDLGLASGPAPDNLPNTGPALTAGSEIRGGTDPVLLGPNTLAFFIVRDPNAPRSIEVWTAPASQPGQLRGPVETYNFSGMNTATVLLSKSTNTWFMYYLNAKNKSISVKTAPAVLLSLEAEPSFTLHQDPADGAAGFNLEVSRVFDANAGDIVVDLASFEAQLSYPDASANPAFPAGTRCVNILDFRGPDFPSADQDTIENSLGTATFGRSNTTGVPWPASLGQALTRLTGSANQECQVDFELTALSEDSQIPIAVPTGLNQVVRRGDARADGEINFADALFVAQHRAGLRDACTDVINTSCLHSINAASVNLDGEFDQVTLADGMFILEYLVGLRDEFYGDVAPPFIRSAIGRETSVQVAFSEPLNPESATNTANYWIDNGISVNNASLKADQVTVTLTTTPPHRPGVTHTLTVAGVEDLVGNPISASPVDYRFDPTLVGLWDFDEDTGTTAGDASGNGNVGTLENGATWVPGRRGNGVGFGGINDRVRVADNASLDFGAGEDFSISLWFRDSTVGPDATGSPELLEKQGTGGAFYQVRSPNSKGALRVQISDGINQDFFNTTAGNLADGQWHHVVVVRDADVGISAYVDAVPAGSDNTVTATSLANDADLLLGAGNTPSGPYDGDLDEVRIYRKALSLAEIGALFSGP